MKISLFIILSTASLINDVSTNNYFSRASKGQFKFVASIYSEGLHMCNGAIITPFHIITVAHCIHKKDFIGLRVIVGSMRITPTTKWREVQKTCIFSDYNPDDYDNDIAIIQLKQALLYANNVKNIPYKETGINCAIELECELIKYKSSETDSILKISQSLWWQNIKMSIENGHRELFTVITDLSGPSYVPFKSKYLEESGAPIVCNGRLTGILNTYRSNTTDITTKVVMVGPYERWIEHQIYLFEVENPELVWTPL